MTHFKNEANSWNRGKELLRKSGRERGETIPEVFQRSQCFSHTKYSFLAVMRQYSHVVCTLLLRQGSVKHDRTTNKINQQIIDYPRKNIKLVKF
ncbi:unnamed protein product [Acanthoscelides obtectus]|uniref:Uncharacterized protein n=1 Tax=Acanthoscelides obtectus TaxID=200917 RepID=A0A9P0L3U3_ACAOB|nr:unnamed protein product [Acanthoscelides obtectus]CAK1622199.1 hypothetical protein AOBTE_LOCUS1365 [Acanthoscelides obtectus]